MSDRDRERVAEPVDNRSPRPDALPVRFDGIPRRATERDNWVLWRYEWDCRDDDHDDYCDRTDCDDGEWTKPPRQPNGRLASTTDPETWSAFDAVRDAYTDETTDWDGVGFVFNGALVGTDWDDVRDPSLERPDESMPPLVDDEIAALDSYIEVSPSGKGYHTIAAGAVPDGNGNRRDLPCDPVTDDGETPHIEMYDESSPRYFTVTGHAVDGLPETVEDRDDAIAALYNRYIQSDASNETLPTETGADVDTGANGATGDDVADPDDDVLKAVDAAREDDAYLDDLLAGAWERHTYRWTGNSHSEARMALAAKLAPLCDYDEAEMVRVFAASGLCRGDDDIRCFRTYEAPRGVALVTGDGDGDAQAPTHAGSVTERDDGYYRYTGDDDEGNPVYKRISNFTITVRSRLLHAADGDRRWQLEVSPAGDDDSYEVVVPTAVFNEPRTFKNEVVTGFGTWFKGGRDALADVRDLLARKDAPTRTAVDKIGVHGDEFVTPAGSLTADGWVGDDAFYVFDRGTNDIVRSWQLTPAVDPDDVDPDELAAVLRLLPRTRDLDRFLPVLAWFYAAPFRPVIHRLTGQFNNAHVTGETEAGKTSTLEMLSQLFGLSDDLAEASGSNFTLEMALSTTNAVPIVLDEYKPSDWSDYQTNVVHDRLRKVTRGATVEKGRPDGSTDSYRLSTPVCVAGEQPIRGPAETRRAVMTAFTERAKAPRHARPYHRLVGGSYSDDDTADEAELFDGHDLTGHALAYYQWVLAQDDETITAAWRDAQATVETLVNAFDATDAKNDTKKGYATVLFGARMYRKFARDAAGLEPADHGVTESAAHDAVRYLTTVGHGAGGQSHVDNLLDVVARAIDDDDYLVEGKHYRRLDTSSHGRSLRLHVPTALDKVMRYARDHDIDDELFGSRHDYQNRFDDAADDPHSPIQAVSVVTKFPDEGGRKRCLAIDPIALGFTDATGETDDTPPSDDSPEAGTGDGDERSDGDDVMDRPQRERIRAIADALQPAHGGKTTAELAGELNADPDTLENHLEYIATHKGHVEARTNGTREPTRWYWPT